MVDNRGIGSIPNIGFKQDNAMANKMSEEKNGQGSEYYAQEMEEELEQEEKKNNYQDRSAQLRASLNGLAMANVGSIFFKKREFEKQLNKNLERKKEKDKNTKDEKEEMFEE